MMTNTTPFSRTLSIFAALFLLHATPGEAQKSDLAPALYNQVFEVMSKISADTARAGARKCNTIGQQLKSMRILSEPLRLDLESLVERCIVVAMNKGGFSDETGNQCTHQRARIQKLAAAIDGWLKEPERGGQDLASRGRELDTTIHNAELLGCKGDYGVFAGTVAATKALKQ